jgi:hypothetical protein
MPDQLIKIMRLPVWQGIMAHFLNDEFASYTGETLVPQKSGYMLASTAALRLVPGSKPQPLHRVSSDCDIEHVCCLMQLYRTRLRIRSDPIPIILSLHPWLAV